MEAAEQYLHAFLSPGSLGCTPRTVSKSTEQYLSLHRPLMELRGLCPCLARREDILHCLCRKHGDEVTTLKGRFIKKPRKSIYLLGRARGLMENSVVAIISMRAQGCGLLSSAEGIRVIK